MRFESNGGLRVLHEAYVYVVKPKDEAYFVTKAPVWRTNKYFPLTFGP